MKRMIIIALCAICGALGVYAQESQYSEDGQSYTYVKPAVETGLQPTFRSGNTYLVGNQAMNACAYMGYLRTTCPAAYVKFSQGHNLSSAGWGFLAGGVALTASAVTMGLAHPVKDGKQPYHYAMDALYYTGNAFVAASIPMLIVGYCKQHNAADLYNEQIGQPQAYFSLNIGENGIGIAYNF